MSAKILTKQLKNPFPFSDESFLAEQISGTTLSDLSFASCKFAVNFNLEDVVLDHVELSDCQFSKNKWNKVKAQNCQFVNCTFKSGLWQDIEFHNCEFYGCEFKSANLDSAAFIECRINQCQFTGPCELSGKFSDTKWFDVIWPETKLNLTQASDCHFYKVDMRGKPFPWQNVAPKVMLDQCEMGELSFKDLKVSNVTLSNCKFDLLDLTNATLTNVDFNESIIKKAQAEGFKGEYLQMAKVSIQSGNFKNMDISVSSIFWEANLKDCDFSNSKMGIAVFQKATLEAINFTGASFTGCNLSDAHLKQVSFKDAKVNNLYVSDTVMDEVEGLN